MWCSVEASNASSVAVCDTPTVEALFASSVEYSLVDACNAIPVATLKTSSVET